jgi:hypothetical protein
MKKLRRKASAVLSVIGGYDEARHVDEWVMKAQKLQIRARR